MCTLCWLLLRRGKIDAYCLMAENLFRDKHEEFGDVKKLVTDEFIRQR